MGFKVGKYSKKEKNELKDFEEVIRNDPNNPVLWDETTIQ